MFIFPTAFYASFIKSQVIDRLTNILFCATQKGTITKVINDIQTDKGSMKCFILFLNTESDLFGNVKFILTAKSNL